MNALSIVQQRDTAACMDLHRNVCQNKNVEKAKVRGRNRVLSETGFHQMPRVDRPMEMGFFRCLTASCWH